ncbi:MAG: flagellar basal body rod protein FlgC [Alphaproteobacteria bacterium]|nr:flagellar basal body rod protein FlgC [Alphaproteobacteria bacterium]
MSDALSMAASIAASGLHAQSVRLRVVSENLANSQSTAQEAGGDPYARKVVSFAEMIDDRQGSARVRVSEIATDSAPFRLVHEPGHPAANAEGYVRFPNVNMISEVADMREATRSYEANLQLVRQAREMISATIDLLRTSR